jgi:hypothetical protein
MASLMSGALVLACAVIGLHFLRFWKGSRDAFFLWFAVAFWIQGAQWLHAGLQANPSDYSPLYYVARVVAYGLIVIAIATKNLRRPGIERGG